MREWKTYKLADLQLDTQNFRIGNTESQREAIRAMIADQKTLLVNLAEDALEVGLSPGEPIWGTPNPAEPGKAIILEGNRRITALKLMENPQLADGTPVERRFAELAKRFADKPIRDIEVLVFDTAEEVEPWIDRRHMSPESGVGLQPWKPIAKNRRARERGLRTERFFAVHELLADHSEEWMELDSRLSDRWTTVDRVLVSAQMPKLLGVKFDPKTGAVTFDNGDVEAGKELLRSVLSVIAQPGFRFADVETKENREEFLHQFQPYSVKSSAGQKKGSKAQSSEHGPSPAADRIRRSDDSPPDEGRPVELRRRPKRDSLDRPTLAPKMDNVLHVTGKRLNPLYRECREIVVEDHKNAASFLLRVFIELSTEAFCLKMKPPRTQWMKDKGFKTWDQRGIRLDDKIEAALTLLDPAQKDRRLDQARLALNRASPASYTVKTLHGYFHNLEFVPDPREIKHAWDAWESYLLVINDKLSAE